MKRMTYFVMALALVLGLAQCKKEQMPDNNQTEGIRITLNVNGGNNGSKVIVDPNAPQGYATVTFESGDIIYVGNNGAYVGYLTYDGTNFSGSIDDSNLNEADYLHFYFMGNKGTTSQPTTVSITDQTSKYPVISYAHSKEFYSSSTSSYRAKLQNYCAIVKFTTTNSIPTDTDITVKGMKNTVSVNFGANNAAAATPTLGVNPYTPGQSGDGDIILHAVSNTERWAILLPQEAVDNAEVIIGSANYTIDVPAIAVNDYVTSGIEIDNTVADYVFSVDGSGTTVHFSPGNLQYKDGEGWRFAEHQYDAIGSWNTSGWVDLFGWGTWGKDKNPLNTSTDESDYQWSTDFQGTLDGHNDWFTLTDDQWQYILEHSMMGWSSVAGVNGYVIRPDGNTTAVAPSYTAEAWASEQASGSVFLPAAGFRYRTDVYVDVGGYYWSSTPYEDHDDRAWYMYFYDGGEGMDKNGYTSYGYSVRLVR